MNVSPAFQAFAQEAPQHQQAWSEAVQALGAASALDDKTAALAYLAVMAAARLDSGLPFHVKSPPWRSPHHEAQGGRGGGTRTRKAEAGRF